MFVVDTANFTDQEAQGVPSGAGKHLVERFALAADGKSVSYESVWRDPEFLADALTGTAELSYRPDLKPAGIACDRETRSASSASSSKREVEYLDQGQHGAGGA